MEPWRKLWIENHVNLAADAKALGDEETYRQSIETAKELAKGAKGK